MDKLKVEGNELCKLILNLGVLDGQMADARRRVQDIDKQQVMIAVIAKLKEDDALGKVDELIGEDDMSASISALVALLEKHETQLKDIGKADSELKTSVEARLGELAALLEKLQARYDPDWDGFAFLLCCALKSDDGSHDTFPDLHAPFQSTEASKLKMLLPALKTCYGILAGLATQSKASPGTLDQGKKSLALMESIVKLVDVSCVVFAFSQDGRMNATADRLKQASTVIGDFYRTLKACLELAGPPQGETPTALVFPLPKDTLVQEVVAHMTLAGRLLSDELVAPLIQNFMANIFSHKHIPDAAILFSQLPLSIVF